MPADTLSDVTLSDVLFTPLRLGALRLPHRIVMPPLTRMRAGDGGAPTALNAEYYAQRAQAALIITEATAISVQGSGLPHMPGVFTSAQVAGWRAVTDGVHACGGRIVMQIVHNGRASHSAYMPGGALPVGPSAIAIAGRGYLPDFRLADYEVPRALETAELSGVVESFRRAALNAMDAGFDGVEIHGANGYLLEQFLEDGANERADGYGGSIENRARLLLEVVEAVGGAIGMDRLGVRLSPHGIAGGVSDGDPAGLFSFVIARLSERRPAYLHLIEARASGAGRTDTLRPEAPNNARSFRPLFDGPLISAGGYTPESAAAAIERGHADAVAFGRLFIANPDLVERIKEDAPLNPHDRATFYGGGAHGYTDYPWLIGKGI